MLFKPYHWYPMYKFLKTETRRMWKKPHVTIGKEYPITHKMLYQPEDVVGYIHIKSIDRFPLGMMTEHDAFNEGGYTLDEYKKVLENITKKTWDNFMVPYVIKFRFRPSDMIDPNGGTAMVMEYRELYFDHMKSLQM